MPTLTVRLDSKTRRELDEVIAETGDAASDIVRKAIHMAWFSTRQDRMRRESAAIAADPEEQAELERISQWRRAIVA